MTTNELIDQFQIIEDRFNQALASNVVGNIAGFLSDDWTLLEPEFGFISKAKFLAAIDTGTLLHTEMKKPVFRVQLAGDVAIVTSRGKNVGTYSRKLFNAEHWVTNVYRNENGDWVCIMTQESPVMC